MDDLRVSNFEDQLTAETHLCDRLSELPNSLTLEILSLLDTKDVVRTTILSKRWKDLWTTVPCLDFWTKNRSFIEGALAKWKGDKILKFCIAFWKEDPPSSDILDSWLLIPIDKKVEQLSVYLVPDLDPQYCVPQRLYSCSSLTNLSLSYCSLKIEDNVNVQWNHLKRLLIRRTGYLSADALNRIISGAPLLEQLVLLSLDITENFNIESTSLKMIKIGREEYGFKTVVKENAMLRVWGPNLLSLEISGCVYGTCLLDVPSLTNAIICEESFTRPIMFPRNDDDFPPLEIFVHVFRSIRHVEKLTLSESSIQLLLDMRKNNMVVQFSNVTFLKLCDAEAVRMLDVLGMFPKLVMFVIKHEKDYYFISDEEPDVAMVEADYSSDHYIMASQITFPSSYLLQLKTIEITWSMRDASIFPIVELLLERAQMLEKMVLRLRNCGSDQNIFILAERKVLSMLRASPTADVIVIKYGYSEIQ